MAEATTEWPQTPIYDADPNAIVECWWCRKEAPETEMMMEVEPVDAQAVYVHPRPNGCAEAEE